MKSLEITKILSFVVFMYTSHTPFVLSILCSWNIDILTAMYRSIRTAEAGVMTKADMQKIAEDMTRTVTNKGSYDAVY